MKTRLLTFTLLLCATFATKAQYVTIPDANFVTWLNSNGFSQCMSGNQMDTTCSEIVNASQLSCNYAGIEDLEGIQYFKNMQMLECENNNINHIPNLSNTSLLKLFCKFNNLQSLPVLSSTLTILQCSNNNIGSLPVLPPNLQDLRCSMNPITVLPNLPSSLQTLEAARMQLSSLPALPNYLTYLNVGYNQLTTMPALPANLIILDCDSNYLQSLPTLPNSLVSLSIPLNAFTTLPVLPAGLRTLNCSENPLSSLAGLPVGLKTLRCYSIQIPSLPTLPLSLRELNCLRNNLTQLPPLPSTLEELYCSDNQLTTLPALPIGLKVLSCGYNHLTTIPNLDSVKTLFCYNNNLNYIGIIPDTLEYFDCSNNTTLNCLPRAKYVQSLAFLNTNITCLPNSITTISSSPSLANFPICNTINNPSSCQIYASISGRTYADNNSNCVFDNNDVGKYGLKHHLYNNSVLQQQTYSNSAGNYSFDQTGLGNYETSLDSTGLPFNITCPNVGVYFDTLTAGDSSHYNRDFALQCKAGFDVAAHSVASAMIFRPANNTTVNIHAGDLANFYSASCAQGVSGTVTVTLHGPISYISPAINAIAPSSVNSNVITWNVADFGTADGLHDFNIIVRTDTFAQIGQQACFDVKITPLAGDNDTSNNHLYHCFNILNSYDPNDKTAYPSGDIDTTQEWLTYTVRFQNTGTAEAQHIYVMDTLDANVKVETFQLLSYSHQPNVQINENIVRFNFPFINLPDSTTDEPGSHGYVQYKVRLKEDLAIGTTINNTAYIYFDFNPPVVTNTATNTIAVQEDTTTVGIGFISKPFNLLVYPNPANQQLTVVTSAITRTVTIYDMLGRIRVVQNMSGTAATIDISNLQSGIYIVKGGNSNIVRKFTKQ